MRCCGANGKMRIAMHARHACSCQNKILKLTLNINLNLVYGNCVSCLQQKASTSQATSQHCQQPFGQTAQKKNAISRINHTSPDRIFRIRLALTHTKLHAFNDHCAEKREEKIANITFQCSAHIQRSSSQRTIFVPLPSIKLQHANCTLHTNAYYYIFFWSI